MKRLTIRRLSLVLLAVCAFAPAAALADTTPTPAAQSQANHDCTTLQTTLDLTSLPSGAYQLAVRRQSEDWHLYPAQVQ